MNRPTWRDALRAPRLGSGVTECMTTSETESVRLGSVTVLMFAARGATRPAFAGDQTSMTGPLPLSSPPERGFRPRWVLISTRLVPSIKFTINEVMLMTSDPQNAAEKLSR